MLSRVKKNSSEALGRSSGGFTTKIHSAVNALGKPLMYIITAGNVHESTKAQRLLESTLDIVNHKTNIKIIADKGYDCAKFTQLIRDRECIPVIPSRCNSKHPREYDKEEYKKRNVVEGFFGKIKHFRRIFSRYDKSKAYIGFLALVGTLIWLR